MVSFPLDAKRLVSEKEAALYLGRSVTRFREGMRKFALPQPSDRNGRRRLWDRRLLDRHVDMLSGFENNQISWDDL